MVSGVTITARVLLKYIVSEEKLVYDSNEQVSADTKTQNTYTRRQPLDPFSVAARLHVAITLRDVLITTPIAVRYEKCTYCKAFLIIGAVCVCTA